ncbi:MAG: YbaK/EbsC family protein [Patescibacteria group bacterium]
MPLPKKLLSSFAAKNIPHAIIEHKKVFTAFDIAATTKTPLLRVAKTLLVKAGKLCAIVVVSAGHMIDSKKLAKALKVPAIQFVKEKDMLKRLKMGAKASLASFGSIYALPVLVDKAFAKQKKALFSAGSFTHSIHMAMKDFVKHEKPQIALIAIIKKIVKKKKK